jgi:hypothetical protein
VPDRMQASVMLAILVGVAAAQCVLVSDRGVVDLTLVHHQRFLAASPSLPTGVLSWSLNLCPAAAATADGRPCFNGTAANLVAWTGDTSSCVVGYRWQPHIAPIWSNDSVALTYVRLAPVPSADEVQVVLRCIHGVRPVRVTGFLAGTHDLLLEGADLCAAPLTLPRTSAAKAGILVSGLCVLLGVLGSIGCISRKWLLEARLRGGIPAARK